MISDFDAPVERVWELWTDPRKLERWWGPPSYPATFETHDLVPGGEVRYFMTSPEGEQHAGMWRVTAVDPPVRLQFDDVFVRPQTGSRSPTYRSRGSASGSSSATAARGW